MHVHVINAIRNSGVACIINRIAAGSLVGGGGLT